MRQSGHSSVALAAGAVLLNLIAGAVVYFVVAPWLFPADDGIPPAALAAIRRGAAGACFIAGALCSLLCVFASAHLSGGGGAVQELLDAVRQPCLLLDEGNRYLGINAEAEKALGLSRERDRGKALDTGIQTALASAGAGPAGIVTRGGVSYQAADHPLPARDSSGQGRRRLIMLRNVDAQVRIRNSFHELGATMEILGRDTRKISESTLVLAQDATRQDSSLAVISSSLDEFSKKIQGNTESAAKGSEFAAQAREVAERSGGEIAHALSAMNDVQDAGVRIARIVKLIDDIAFQTNLLALNASVEAARAGRQGKGFAVVADEVRNLAGRSAKAAKDTASMVEDVTERISNASAYISKLEEMLRNIVQEAVRIADYSASAGVAASEQATTILQVNQGLGQINNLTRSTSAAAQQASSSMADLAGQVEGVRQRIESCAAFFGSGAMPERDGYAPAQKRPFGYRTDPDTSPFAPAITRDGYGKFDANPFDPGQATSADEDFIEPFRKMAIESRERRTGPDGWIASSPDSPGEDEFRNSHDDFFGINRIKNEQIAPTPPPAGEIVEYRTTSEGDKVVKPEQNIHLDDAEFGRY